jgi:RimJ/RimL family protein N-acetyltransferase
MSDAEGPAYRIVTDRLEIRCWQPADAGALKQAIDSSLEHLRPWMPWAAHEPEPLYDKVDRLRAFRALFDRDEDYIYGIFERDSGRVAGGTGLHLRHGPNAREIGYWLRADLQGQGLMTEAVGALTKVAFEVDEVRWVEIRCQPENGRSAAVPRRLGFAHEATLAARVDDAEDGQPRDLLVFSMMRDNYAGSACSFVVAEAYDAAGERLL